MATHAHREAFCHMLYRADDGSDEEWLWNSRDGVTPFVLSLRSGVEARHVEWNRNRYDPGHVPAAGERIFVDLHPERALYIAKVNVDAWWDHPEWPMSEMGVTRERAMRVLADSYLAQPGSPDVVEVTPLMRTGFAGVISPAQRRRLDW